MLKDKSKEELAILVESSLAILSFLTCLQIPTLLKKGWLPGKI